MRVDQYLWCIRLFKSRNLSSSICKKGQVKVNGQKAKPSKEILPHDKIEVKKNQLLRILEVLDIPKNRISAKLVALYVTEKTDLSTLKNKKLKNLSNNFQREAGTGRPTKKDRREINELKIREIDNEDL